MTSQSTTAAAAHTLADISRPSGGFAMLAVDQREAMRLMFAAAGAREPVPDSTLTEFKVAATAILSPYASAVLVDRDFCLDAVLAAGAIAPSCGLIIAADAFHPGNGIPVDSVTIDEGIDPQAPEAADRLRALGAEAFAPFWSFPDVQALWWPRFLRVADWFLGWERGRRAGLAASLTELSGRLEWQTVGGRSFRLNVRADRIDTLADGSLAVIDYKTGTPPTPKQVASGLTPQLSLEAAMIASDEPDWTAATIFALLPPLPANAEPATRVSAIASLVAMVFMALSSQYELSWGLFSRA